MLLPMAVPGAAAHNQPTRDLAPALGTDPVCADLAKGNVAGTSHACSNPRGIWHGGCLGCVDQSQLSPSCSLQEGAGPGAGRTLVVPLQGKGCVPMMQTQPCTSQPGWTRQDPAPDANHAANSPQGCVQLRVVWAEPITVSSRYTDWNPSC